MQLRFAILADSAQVGPDGKIFMIGGDLDTIGVARFPAQHPNLTLVVQLIVERSEAEREHVFQLSLISPLQATLAQSGGPFNPRVRPDLAPDLMVKATIIMNMMGLEFAVPGTYRFRIAVDGEPLGEVPVYLKLASQLTADSSN